MAESRVMLPRCTRVRFIHRAFHRRSGTCAPEFLTWGHGTASSAQTAPSSTSVAACATGGTTWNAASSASENAAARNLRSPSLQTSILTPDFPCQSPAVPHATKPTAAGSSNLRPSKCTRPSWQQENVTRFYRCHPRSYGCG